jgi:hypothetical protein
MESISLRSNSGAAKMIIDFWQDYVDIVPIGSLSLFSLQLGGETAGHMLHFTNGNFGTINFGRIGLVDGTNAANTANFVLTLNEVDLTGAGFDVNANGLVFTDADFGANSAGTAAMDVTLSDIRMGGASAASIGTIGMQNIKVTNLVMTVAGKN